MLNRLIRKVHTRLEDCKRWLGANGVPSHFQVLLDAPNMLMGAVCCLLYNRLCVRAEGLDEALLRLGTGCLDCELPKP